MGLRGLRPSAAIVKVMSVPDSRCIRVVTPDDHVNIGFHEVLLHDMEDEDLPFVATSELGYLHGFGQRPCLCSCLDTSMIWNECGSNANNVSVARNRGTVLIVGSIFSGIWASTLPCITWNSHSCGVVRLCGAQCGRGPLSTVLITCGGLTMFL